MKRVLITGGSGFLGTNLLQHHIELGDVVRSIDLRPPKHRLHDSLWHRSDIRVADDLERQVEEFRPTHVYHLAARTDLDGKSLDDYRANTIGVANVIDVFERYGALQRIVFGSSRLVCKIGYQPKHDKDYLPTTAYGQSKVYGEDLVRNTAQKLPWTIVRPTSIWGEWFGVPYNDFFSAIRDGKYYHPSGHDIRKSFGYVGNSVYQLAKLLSAETDRTVRRTFYIADYPPLQLKEFATMIQRSFGAPKIRTAPRWLLRLGGRVGDLLQAMRFKTPITTFRVSNLVTEMVYDLSALQTIVGQLPYSTREGVERTVRWMQTDLAVPRNNGQLQNADYGIG